MSDLVVAQPLTTPAPMIAPVSKKPTGGAATDWRDFDPFAPRSVASVPAWIRVMPNSTFDAYRGM